MYYEQRPFPYRAPHYPPTDLEPAFVVKPGEDCCPSGKDECVCVTSGDAARWDHAADILDNLTEEEIDALSGISAFTDVAESADLWNSCYDTVSANSADWSTIASLSGFSADVNNKFDEIDTKFDAVDSAISAVDAKIPHYYFATSANVPQGDPWSITGDGTSGAPFGVRNWYTFANLSSYMQDLQRHIYGISADELGNITKHYIDSLDDFATESALIFDGNYSYYKKLEDDIASIASSKEDIKKIVDEEVDDALNKKGVVTYKELADTPKTSEEAAQYKDNGIIYYCEG